MTEVDDRRELSKEFHATGTRLGEVEDHHFISIFTALAAGTVFLLRDQPQSDVGVAFEAAGALHFLVGVAASIARLNVSRRLYHAAAAANAGDESYEDYLLGMAKPSQHMAHLMKHDQLVYNGVIYCLFTGALLVLIGFGCRFSPGVWWMLPLILVLGTLTGVLLFKLVRWALRRSPTLKPPKRRPYKMGRN